MSGRHNVDWKLILINTIFRLSNSSGPSCNSFQSNFHPLFSLQIHSVLPSVWTKTSAYPKSPTRLPRAIIPASLKEGRNSSSSIIITIRFTITIIRMVAVAPRDQGEEALRPEAVPEVTAKGATITIINSGDREWKRPTEVTIM